MVVRLDGELRIGGGRLRTLLPQYPTYLRDTTDDEHRLKSYAQSRTQLQSSTSSAPSHPPPYPPPFASKRLTFNARVSTVHTAAIATLLPPLLDSYHGQLLLNKR